MTRSDNMGADDRLKALFAEDLPPARDLTFSTAVMAEIARQQFLQDVAQMTGATIIGGIILWLLWPALTPVLTTMSQGLAPVAACLTLAAIVITLAGGRPEAALGLEHD